MFERFALLSWKPQGRIACLIVGQSVLAPVGPFRGPFARGSRINNARGTGVSEPESSMFRVPGPSWQMAFVPRMLLVGRPAEGTSHPGIMQGFAANAGFIQECFVKVGQPCSSEGLRPTEAQTSAPPKTGGLRGPNSSPQGL